MTIKAVLRNGSIQPLEPLPAEWTDGQELVVEPPETIGADGQISEWAKDLDKAAAQLPTEEHDRFQRALTEIGRDSKEAVRQEWGLS
jgi:hypothetical protein